MNQDVIEQRRQLLAERLAAIERLRSRLVWSCSRVGFPLTGTSLANLDEAHAESLSAFIERFSKLQDLLGSTFREVVSLSGQSAEDYNLVLGAMEKAGVVVADDWRALRVLRNEVAHEYALDTSRQAERFNALHMVSDTLLASAAALALYCAAHLHVPPRR